MKYNLKDVIGDREVKPSTNNGNTQYIEMVPPTETLSDGSIEVTGFVKDVKISDWKFDSEKHQLVIQFTAPDGSTQRKWITDPEFDGRITKQEDEAKRLLMSGFTLKEVKNNVGKYIYSSAIDQAIVSLGDEWTFEEYCNKLGEVVNGEKNRVDQSVSLKLVLTESVGAKPKYKIGQSYYLGVEESAYPPKFIKKGDQYDDITNFSYSEELPDFSSQTDVLDIFSTGTLNPGTLL